MDSLHKALSTNVFVVENDAVYQKVGFYHFFDPVSTFSSLVYLNCVSSRHWVKAHFYFHPNNKLNFNIF
jgi:hypothetical protein